MKFRLLMVLMLVFVMVMPAFAQDETTSDLSEEEIALLERVNALIEAAQEYTSFTSVYESEQTQSIAINVPALSMTQVTEESNLLSAERNITFGETPAGTQVFTASYSTGDGTDTFSYEATGEMRYVDGRLFYNVTATDTSETTPASIPFEFDGTWYEVDEYTYFASIGLSDFRDVFEDENSMDDVFAQIASSASSVTSEMQEIEGVEYEVISVAFDGAGFADFLVQSDENFDPSNPVITAMVEAITAMEDNVMAFVVAVDADGMIAARNITANLTLSLDSGTLDASLEGGTFDMTLIMSQTEELSNINGEMEAVELPEGFE